MDKSATIRELGLSEPEADVYLALLRLGGCKASIVAKDVGLKRTTAYPILKSLAQKGFVSVYFRKSQHFYYAQKPGKVANLFQKKLETFESMIPLLENMEKKETARVGLQFIETLDELKEFYRGVLDEYKNKEYCIIGSATAWEGLDPKFFIQFRKDRGKNNIHTKLLLTEESKNINPTDSRLLREFKYLPKKYRFKSTVDIYKDKILIVSSELSSLAVVIAIPAMVDVFRSVFEMLWDDKKVLTKKKNNIK